MIPQPHELTYLDGSIQLPLELALVDCPSDFLSELIQRKWRSILAKTGYQPAPGTLQLRYHSFARLAASHPDMHLISIQPEGVTLSAKNQSGFLYAVQTLLQLLYEAAVHNNGNLPCQQIVDYPEFDWRGLHLDESRHFFGVETVLHYLDSMAALKLNKFHWHLTDDQGFRIQSIAFPLLTEVGVWRKEPDGSVYGGFYTPQDIRRVVAYAADLGIEVVPELDLPGHAMAILAAYPELACKPGKFEPLTVWGISDDILCAGKDEVVSFLKALTTEIAELFPGNYFHLGGDEAPKDRWKECPHCQRRIREQGLSSEEELQSWLLKEITAHLRTLGKTVIGWDEILEGNIDSEPVVMLWRGDARDAAVNAVLNGNRYILCPNKICYFDWKMEPESPGAHGVSTLQNVFSFAPETYPGQNLCLGGQANLWTEYIHNPRELANMLFPRGYALAERLWNTHTSYPDFLDRINALEGYLDTL